MIYKTRKQAERARDEMGGNIMTHCICRVEDYKRWRGGYPVAAGYTIKPYNKGE